MRIYVPKRGRAKIELSILPSGNSWISGTLPSGDRGIAALAALVPLVALSCRQKCHSNKAYYVSISSMKRLLFQTFNNYWNRSTCTSSGSLWRRKMVQCIYVYGDLWFQLLVRQWIKYWVTWHDLTQDSSVTVDIDSKYTLTFLQIFKKNTIVSYSSSTVNIKCTVIFSARSFLYYWIKRNMK